MDRHLNLFEPYERQPTHEDQLTRAAMIVLRAVPLARDAFLARLGCGRSGALPEPEVDMQARDVVSPGADETDDAAAVDRLVSVFLSPDDGLDLSNETIVERDWEQRLDGVVRFGDELVVVIESKVVGRASSRQASELRLRGVTFAEQIVVPLGWHTLLRDWWGLLERGLLAPAERVLIEDLASFAEAHFPHLLPFTTLREAGDHLLRRQRRLLALVRDATGVDQVRRRPEGAEAMLDAAIGTHSIQRLMLVREGNELVLATAAAELKPQALAFYGTGRAAAALSLAADDGWDVRPNLYLGYRGAQTLAQRLYPTCQLPAEQYVRQLLDSDLEYVGGYAHDTVRSQLWPWLRDRGYAGPDDDVHLDAFLDGLGRRDAHLRPSLEITRRWPWSEAEQLDEDGLLVGELRTATGELLRRLDEPLPPACA